MLSNKSAISLSMPKAGSSICDLILTDFYIERGFEIDRIALQVPKSPRSEPEIFTSYQDKIKPEGAYYGVARGKYVSDMTVLRNMRLFVQVRDPRDCLTSAYFSFSKSHKPPRDPAKLEAFRARQEKIRDTTIDTYVCQNANDYRDRLRRLRQIVQASPDALLLTYEEMVQATDEWLAKIADHTGQPLTSALQARLGNKIDFTVDKEDPKRHKRQVSPGDHARKLSAETISAINEILQHEMQFFGYHA